MIEREYRKLELYLGGIKTMDGLPDALFVIDAENERIAIKEANKLKIPVISVVDTNSDPDGVDYVIPGNDDAYRAIKLYVQTAADTIIAAKPAAPQSHEKDEFVEITTKKSPKVTKESAEKQEEGEK